MNEHNDDDEMELERIAPQMRELGEKLSKGLRETREQTDPRGPAGIVTVDDALTFLDQIQHIPDNLDLNQYHDFSDITVVLDKTHDVRLATKLIEKSLDDSDISVRDGLLPLLKDCNSDPQICAIVQGLLSNKPPNRIEWACALAEWFPHPDYEPELIIICTDDEYDSDAQDRAFGALETLVDEFSDPELKSRVDELRQTRFEHLA